MNFKETINWYDQNAQSYARATVNMTVLEDLISFANLLPSQAKILDAGCGAGRDTNIFSQLGFQTYGMDFSGGMIDEAGARYPDEMFIQGDFRHLPFDRSAIDGIWAHASLVHLETTDDVKVALNQFNRVLKLGGLLYLLVKAQTGSEKTAVVSDKLSGHERFFQYFTKDEIQTLMVSAGFRVLRLDQYNEAARSENGRPEVEWIVALGQKQ